MIRKLALGGFLLSLCCLLGGCTGIGDKSLGLTVIYGAAAVASLCLLLLSIVIVKRREPWLIVLFSCVSVVNLGYFLLALSSTVDEALFSNGLSYLGSVFLLPSMMLIILRACGLSCKRGLPPVLAILGLVVFFVTLTPLYYTEVSLEIVDGTATLIKHYGPLHALYPIYLFAYFAAMVFAIGQASIKKRLLSNVYAILLASAVFINIGVWLLEQLVAIRFELLSVSYIVSEIFLLGIHLMSRAAREEAAAQAVVSPTENTAVNGTDTPAPADAQKLQFVKEHLPALTPTEKAVLNLYLEGKSTKEVLLALDIKENTLKYHNRNLYSKLGVNSRKELVFLVKQVCN